MLTPRLIATTLAFCACFSAVAGVYAIQENTPQPGWRYQVTGVRSDDVLNVRDRPGVEAAKIGVLAPGQTGVTVTGQRVVRGGSVWWSVPSNGQTGWVNARYLTPQAPGAERESGYALRCLGTEPFWSVLVSGETARYFTPEEETSWTASEWLEAVGRPETFAIRLQSPAGTGYAAVHREYRFCSDGMSDIQHPFNVLLIKPDGEVQAGCCARAAP